MNKRLKIANKICDLSGYYTISDAIDAILKYKDECGAKFDESVDIIIKLGIDSKKQDQMIKGFVELPHGNGKKNRVLVFTEDQIDAAIEFGATYAGSDELIDKVANGSITDFDKCIATKNVMMKITKLARVLGPKGLMPNPKLGTVVDGDIKGTLSSLLKGRSNIKTDKDCTVKFSIGKVSFGKDKLLDNFKEAISAVKQLKPASVKSNYLCSVILSPTMGFGIKIKMSDVYSV